MTQLDILLDEERVNAYLEKHGLLKGFVPITAVMLNPAGTSEGNPVAMFVVEVDGKKVLGKVTLEMLEIACKAMRAAMNRLTSDA